MAATVSVEVTEADSSRATADLLVEDSTAATASLAIVDSVVATPGSRKADVASEEEIPGLEVSPVTVDSVEAAARSPAVGSMVTVDSMVVDLIVVGFTAEVVDPMVAATVDVAKASAHRR